MDDLLEQVRTLVSQADNGGRSEALAKLRALQLQLEKPHDTLFRFSGLHLEIAAARIGEDLCLFQILVDNAQPLTTAELSAKTGAAVMLLGRLLRYLAAAGMIGETAAGTFAANELTRTLAHPGYRGAIYHKFDNMGPILQAFPEFLKEHKYQDMTDHRDTAFNRAFSTDMAFFPWIPTMQPRRFEMLQQFMTVAAPESNWFSVFPFAAEMEGFDGPTVLVDVGGGFGHQCHALLASFPQLAEKLVLEDLPATLALAPAVEGIRAVAHDFFQPQPERGARFYYLRHVLHDWPDKECVAILGHLRHAMSQDSRILIDESVLPNAGVPLAAAMSDLKMMATFGSGERTIDEWRALLHAAGLDILRLHTYGRVQCEAIIECVGRAATP